MNSNNSPKLNEGCIFCKIVDGEKKEEFVYEDDQLIALSDHQPRTPVHLLVITKKHFQDVSELLSKDPSLVAEIGLVVEKLVDKFSLRRGYTWGFHAGGKQTVNHVHAQLLGGMQKDELVL